MSLLTQQVLRTDLAGMPLEWVDYRDAARLHVLGLVAYSCGDPLFLLHGGINAGTGRQSQLRIHSIIAGQSHQNISNYYWRLSIGLVSFGARIC